MSNLNSLKLEIEAAAGNDPFDIPAPRYQVEVNVLNAGCSPNQESVYVSIDLEAVVKKAAIEFVRERRRSVQIALGGHSHFQERLVARVDLTKLYDQCGNEIVVEEEATSLSTTHH